ncbi:MAG: penicillin-binding protein 2 [Chloroflexi bacterium]|nr:penicillin-binding protein 2 [Chloroflexota bacterium]
MPASFLSRAPLRMRVALVIILAVGILLAARLFYWQIIRWDDLRTRADAQRDYDVVIPARRGDIFTRDDVLVAKDVFLYTISVSPKTVRNPETLATDLAPILGQPRDTILGKLKSTDTTVYLARDVPATIGEMVQDYKERTRLFNLTVTAKPVRLYPNGQLAAPVVGIVNAERMAAYGVEQAKDADLRGKDGKLKGSSNALNDPIPFDLPSNIPATDGATIWLTIDSGMQRIVEQELANAIRDSKAESGSIIVMDPRTGAILALAVWPTADLNRYFDPANQGKYANQAIGAQYEPGSVFKIITAAAGLDAGVITPNSCFEDSGSIYIGGRIIKNHSDLAPGHVCLTEVLRQSLNVEATKIAISLGTERFYQYVQRFGFGARTRVEQAGEAAGDVKQVGDGRWREVDLGTNSFGQGIAVTPIQMIASVAAVANGGKLMRPYIVKAVQPANAIEPMETTPEVVRQVIKPETARTLTLILANAILGESSNKAVVQGYTIAGKTGTAQIPIGAILDPRWTIASFVGYFPADDPRFVILVKLDKPQSSEWGSQVASPVFATIAKQLVVLAGLPPDNVRLAIK